MKKVKYGYISKVRRQWKNDVNVQPVEDGNIAVRHYRHVRLAYKLYFFKSTNNIFLS